MDDTYNWGYYVSHCGENYENEDYWTGFFGQIADNIIRDLNPSTVLDVGCAVGYLVAALRDRGVEAYGVDVSAAALSKAREDIRPYLTQYSLLDNEKPSNLPEYFDLVTNIEVLEHIYEEDAAKAFSSLCSFSDRILFSSSPDDTVEETHVNVRQPEYWVKLFAQQNFFRSMSYEPKYISPNTIYFTKQENMDMPRLAEDYEHCLRLERLDSKTKAETFGWESYNTIVQLDNGNGLGEPIVHNSIGPHFSYELEIPIDTKVIRFIPPIGFYCFIKNATFTAGGQALTIYNAYNKILPPVMPICEPNQPLYANVDFVSSTKQPIILKINAEIYLATEDHVISTLKMMLKLNHKVKGEFMLDEASSFASYDELVEDRLRWIDAANGYMHLHEEAINSTSWAITKPFRFVSRLAKKVFSLFGRIGKRR